MSETARPVSPLGQSLALPVIGKSTSRIGFGTGGLLRIGSPRRRQDALAAAFASGITHFDTAPLYGFGESERALGLFLRGRRDKLTLTTKFGLQAAPLAARLAVFQRLARTALKLFPVLRKAAVRHSGALYTPPSFSLPEVRASLDKSLRALRTDYVDFFLAHQASSDALPGEDLLGWLEDARRAGKILAFGVATDFDWLLPVLRERPMLANVVQFDNDLIRQNATSLGRAGRLLITYGFIGRAIALCRERFTDTRTVHAGWRERVADDELGALLLRAAVLANPQGIVLMQSRSNARIERNVRVATSAADDERVMELVSSLESRS